LPQGWTAQDYKLGYSDGNWLQIDAGSVQGIAGVSIQVRIGKAFLMIWCFDCVLVLYVAGGTSFELVGNCILCEDIKGWEGMEFG
jgi:hypothetical protein